MSDANIQKQRRYWCKRTTQDKDDAFAEKINMGLILFFGVLSIISSITLIVYSVVLVIYKQQFLMALLKSLIVAALLLAIGLGSLYLFRKRLRMLARKKNPWRL